MSSETCVPLPDDIAISAKALSKTYRLFSHPGDRIKQFLTFSLRKYHRNFTALQNISFEIRKGETVGIIGRNGSGKSTLLQLCSGILRPTSGSVSINGRISALLELGAGFNPEFTGRENVYFQGAILGFTKPQMDARFKDIVDFAGIGNFIDEPVRSYSSGMFVRLAFATAINTDPDILIIDEALGVGDAEFQERCFTRMRMMQKSGTTILFVSHAIPAVRNFCDRAIWMDKGTIRHVGPAGEVCRAYLADTLPTHIGNRETAFEEGTLPQQWETKQIRITRASINNEQIHVGENISLQLNLKFSSVFSDETTFGIGVIIHNAEGRLVTLFNTIRDDIFLSGQPHRVTLELSHTAFVPGRYWVSINICDHDVMFAYDQQDCCLFFEVIQTTNCKGIPRWEGDIACEHTWRF